MSLQPVANYAEPSQQIETLSWVLGEVRKSAGVATGAIKHALVEKAGAPTLTGAKAGPSNMRTAGAEMRRAAGALHMVGQAVCGDIFADIGTSLDRCSQQPELINVSLEKVVDSACFAVNTYLNGVSHGRTWASKVLLPVAAAVAGLAGRGSFHPAQVWEDAASDVTPAPNWAGLGPAPDATQSSEIELALLRLLQGVSLATQYLIDALHKRGQAHHDPVIERMSYFGGLFLLSVGEKLVELDLYGKRTIGRLGQWANGGNLSDAAAQSLTHECKYFLSQIDPSLAAERLPLLMQLVQERSIESMDQQKDPSHGEFRPIDPQLPEAAGRDLAGCKEAWTELAAGDFVEGSAAVAQFEGLHQSILRLRPELAIVTTSLCQCVRHTVQSRAAPSASLSLEVATALLFVEDSLDDLYSASVGIEKRAQVLFDRLDQARSGAKPEALQDWMEALFRRAGEEQALGNVAGELRFVAAEIETLFEAIFNDTSGTHHVSQSLKLQTLLNQMKGVLGVVGLAEGVATIVYLRKRVDSIDVDLSDFDQRKQLISYISTNMAALGLMVDMLGYQPLLATQLFKFDPAVSTLTMLGSPSESVSVSDFVELTHAKNVSIAPALQTPVRQFAQPLSHNELVSAAENDIEIKEVFALEAQGVVKDGLGSVSLLARDAKDLETLVLLRRGFHTLKGSARMARMDELGEAAWVMEQLLNEQMTDQSNPISANLCELSKDALGVIGRWSHFLGQGQDPGWTHQPFVNSANILRAHDRYEPIQMPRAVSLPSARFEAAANFDVIPASDHNDVFVATDTERSELAEADATSDPSYAELPLPNPAKAWLGPYVAKATVTPESNPGVLDGKVLERSDQASSVDPVDALIATDMADTDQFKLIGPLKIRFSLYNIYLQEADEGSRALETLLSEWVMERGVPLPIEAVHLVHTLAGSSSTVGFAALAALCRHMETAFTAIRSKSLEGPLLIKTVQSAIESLRFLLHQFAAGFLKSPPLELVEKLVEIEQMPPRASGLRLVGAPDTEVSPSRVPDTEILALFVEEARDLVPEIGNHLRAMIGAPDELAHRQALLRVLHTLKGGARLAGEMQIGDWVHQMESDIESTALRDKRQVEALLDQFDQIEQSVEAHAKQLNFGKTAASGSIIAETTTRSPAVDVPATPAFVASYAEHASAQSISLPESTPTPSAARLPEGRGNGAKVQDNKAEANVVGALALTSSIGDISAIEALKAAPVLPSVPLEPMPLAVRDVLSLVNRQMDLAPLNDVAQAARLAPVRVNARLLDSMMNRAGEVIGSRARVKLEVDHLRGSLGELDTNIDKLRLQLREMELQADLQMQSQQALHKDADKQFDPLEFDRFTRVQELTRMMAESVSDVATVQRNLEKSIEQADNGLIAQGRQSSDLQRELLRTRMVSFETITQRLYRTARLASKDVGASVNLEMKGGNLEVDRQQLERMGASLEHLVRNSVTHGIESPEERLAAGKPEVGSIVVSVMQDHNEVVIEITDDGRGLDLERIKARGITAGLLKSTDHFDDQRAFDLICLSGFSTASSVTEWAGRGVGMDVVKSSMDAAGGRIEARNNADLGLAIRLILPLTTVTTQVLLVRHSTNMTAFPVNIVDQVLRFTPKQLQIAYNEATITFNNEQVPFYWAGALLGLTPRSERQDFRTQPVIVVRSAGRRVAVHVEETIGPEEVVVKGVGSQLSSLPGLTGVSVLPSGQVVLIYNPVALALVYGDQIARFSADRASAIVLGATEIIDQDFAADALVSVDKVDMADPGRPGVVQGKHIILVVDDSITVRKSTQRLLERAGYRVALANDGVHAIEQLRGNLAHDRPLLILADIEMPRMDGFEMVRTLKADSQFQDVPIAMITSRLAEKHREVAARLGVNHYFGKPYVEQDLLAFIAGFSQNADAALAG